ncbi:MAG TPA: hypothetical protein VK509_16925 [Polyangiales bacterium]|nr:hypothetical protein [Polyangiales bacterium]
MHSVALTRWESTRTVEVELAWLAPLMGLLPYDARLRLNTGMPVVVARGCALADAQQRLSAIRTHGHGAVVIDESSVPRAERMPVVASFELRDAELIAQVRGGPSHTLPFAQLLGVVRAIEVCEQEHAVETVEKKLAIGRALLSGGLMTSKTVHKSTSKKSLEHEQVAYLFRCEAAEPLLLRESSLSYAGLGSERGVSAHESFMRLMKTLRERAPSALHDDRLCVRKRRAEQTTVRGTSSEQTRASTNSTANDMAAYVLVQAHLQGQL